MPYRRDSAVGRFLDGDEEAVGQVIRWVSHALSWPGFWRLRREWRDLHQEIMYRVTESLRRERFDGSRDFQAYVYGIARLTGLKALSRLSGNASTVRESAHMGVLDAGVEQDAEQTVFYRQMARQVLDWSSDDCRELIRAYFFEQESYREIARQLQVPVGTVKSRLFRCLESAHRHIFEEGVPGPQPQARQASSNSGES